MRVLVTGAAGFVGSHLCEHLIDAGHEVLGIDNFDDYYDLSQKRANQARLESRGVSVEFADIRDFDSLARIFWSFKPNKVAHLAGKAGVRNSISNPREYVDVNLNGTQNVLEASRALAVDRVVFASTSSVYNGAQSPFNEAFPATAPLQPYAASKRGAELLASTYSTLYGLSTIITRFFTVYGPNGRPDMMPHKLLRSAAWGERIVRFEGNFQRDWTYVSDICDGLVRALSVPGLQFEILNLGRGEPQSLSDFISCVEESVGKKANIELAKAPATEMLETFADTAKAGSLIGFSPEVCMTDGVKKMVAWFEETHQIGR